ANEESAFANLAAEVETGVADLDRFQQFLDRIDRARQAETAAVVELALAAGGSDGGASAAGCPRAAESPPPGAARSLIEALQRYGIVKRDDWKTALDGSFLRRQQIERIGRLAYGELLWLADDVLRRAREHGSDPTLSPEAAARQALLYLRKAD